MEGKKIFCEYLRLVIEVFCNCDYNKQLKDRQIDRDKLKTDGNQKVAINNYLLEQINIAV